METLEIPEPRVYGGWTTCAHIETADGFDIVIDCGSGFRNCASELQRKWGDESERHLQIFGTHSHYDHTEGFDQAAVCFDPRNTVHVYGNHQFLHALDLNLGIFSRSVDEGHLGVQTPLFYELMPAKFEACELRDCGAHPPPKDDALAGRYHDYCTPLRFGETTVSMTEVFHPAPCLAYRIERAGKSFVFCTDHELFRGADDDPRHEPSRAAETRVRELARGADLLYRDGQFLHVEYDGLQGIGSGGPVSRQGWGHSCVEDVMDMAESCKVGRTLIGHHDPNRDWSERNWIDETLARRCEQTGLSFELAQAETVVEL
jgi:phosphoribosyl 1,2-cyclic phosphodiesterase